jgi:hypothetical protein
MKSPAVIPRIVTLTTVPFSAQAGSLAAGPG